MSRFSKTITVRLPDDLKQKVDEEASRRLLRAGDIVREALMKALPGMLARPVEGADEGGGGPEKA